MNSNAFVGANYVIKCRSRGAISVACTKSGCNSLAKELTKASQEEETGNTYNNSDEAVFELCAYPNPAI